MNNGTIDLEVFRVFGVNGGVFSFVTLVDIETSFSIALLFLTCVWTCIKIYKLLKK